MARVKAPLFSISAQKQLGKALIYKMKENRAFVTGYGFPGSKNKATPSVEQTELRSFYGQQVASWRALSQMQKDVFDATAKRDNLKISGWNLYYQMQFDASIFALDDSIFGIRLYGGYNYGQN